ncbi:MAG: HPr family phosphocarrier protein [Lachnospiraceae bacterium]|jgi:catabolite repression HPr-like protein|nr:HPr family phosphocarrier protein [Lachnospiraceae bacterium]
MIKKSVRIHLSNGLEARPVALLVQVASQFESTVYLETSDKRVNAKSIMGMMNLGLDNGEEVSVVCEGVDEESAMTDVERFLLGEAS